MIDIQPFLDKLDKLQEYIDTKIGLERWRIPDWIKQKYNDHFNFPSFEEWYELQTKQ